MDYLTLIGVVTLGAIVAYYLLQTPKPIERPPIDLNDQCIEVPGTDGGRVSYLCDDHLLTVTFYDDVETLYDGFQKGLIISGDKRCLGWKPSENKPYQWLTYKEVNDRATAFGAGLVNLGLPEYNTRVGIYSQNRPEYVIADQALFRHSFTSVPLYENCGVDICSYIINQADLSTIICDNNERVKTLLDQWKQFSILKTVFILDPLNNENRLLAKTHGLNLLQFEEAEKLGKENPVAAKPPKPNDLCLVCYTSGTTGNPKGIMLTHANIIASVAGGQRMITACGFTFSSNDCLISYLPLAHSYERAIQTLLLMNGGHIGFFQGDIKKLMDDIKELKPTIFPTVPRLLNRLYDKVIAGVNKSRFKKCLFNMAIKSKTKELKRGIIRKNSMWDKLVFRKVQTALGGRMRIIVTGSAPISGTVLSFLRCIVGCPILEGYGQTENAAAGTFTLIGDCEIGHVGPPLPCTMIKLIDVPEMDYYSNHSQGEVCFKGANVFVGYLKNEELTKEAIDDNGWLHSGDIGEWLPNGTLKIIDRKKNIFKLAQGEYIAPEKIENILITSQWCAQVYVHGNSLKAFLVALVVPDPDNLPILAGNLGIQGTYEQLIDNPEMKNAILDDLTCIGKRSNLSSLEMVKDIKLHPKMFSVENGFLTPTFKMKRHKFETHFALDFENMYKRLEVS